MPLGDVLTPLARSSIPVFFIQDGVAFPNLIHAAKPAPQVHLPQAQTAHDNHWDFMSLTPESVFMSLYSLSDHTIPRSYRMIQGFGVNTFVLVNKEGKRTFVKCVPSLSLPLIVRRRTSQLCLPRYHWRPQLGAHGLVWDEALKLGGQDPDFLVSPRPPPLSRILPGTY